MTPTALLRERLPHAPQMGLYVEPDLPADKVRKALSDYATDVERGEVRALYDATLSGTAGDGAVFCADRLVFQNNDLQSVQTVRYPDLVGVEAKSRWWGLGGRVVALTVNRGRATFDLSLDCSGRPDAAAYIADALHALMIEGVDLDAEEGDGETDVAAVRRVLQRLQRDGRLTDAAYERLMQALEAPSSSSDPSR
ncbi:MAG: hypothetical protein ABEL97_13100 [Salinibacter sp.]